jgi:hypothetical protein
MKIEKQMYEDICFGDLASDGPYKVIEDGEWIDDGKCSYKDVIFSFEGKSYSIGYSRSGSYHTDYSYDWEYEDGPFDCCEVEQKEITVKKWIAVKE